MAADTRTRGFHFELDHRELELILRLNALRQPRLSFNCDSMDVKLLAKWPFETRGEWHSRPIYGGVTAALLIDFMCDVNSLHNTLRCGWRWLLRVTPHSEQQPTRLIEDSEASCEKAFSAFGIVSNKSATRLLVGAHSNVMFASNCTSLARAYVQWLVHYFNTIRMREFLQMRT